MTEQNLSARMRQGAELLGKIKVKAFAAKPTDVPTAVFPVIEEEKYPFLPPQLGVLPHAILLIMKYRTAVEELRLLQGVNPETASAVIAGKLGCNSGDIRQIIIHDVSATAILSNSSFLTVCEDICRKEQVDVSHAKSIAGMASKDFYVKIGDNTLPVSIQNEADERETTAQHENLHVQYTLFHPYYAPIEKPSSEKEPTTNLTETVALEACHEDFDAFRKTIESVTYDYLYLYLNELSSSALTKSPIYHRFFNDDEYYHARFAKRINAIRLGLPNDEKRIPFERAIYEEVEKVKHKIKYIEDRYRRLTETEISPEQLITKMQILTPELGYTINSFLTDSEKTPEEESEWQEEYENGWKPKNRGEKINDWVNFIATCAQIKDEDYHPIRARFKKTVSDYKAELYSRLKGRQSNAGLVSFDVESLIWHIIAVASSRLWRLQTIFDSGYFNQLNLADDKKEEIRRRALSIGTDFHEVFLGLISSFNFNLNAIYTSDQTLYLYKDPRHLEEFEAIVNREMRRLGERSLSLDDAAEDLVEVTAAGEEPDWSNLSAPGYKKTDEKRKRALTAIYHEGVSETRFTSPLEHWSIAVFKKLCTIKV